MSSYESIVAAYANDIRGNADRERRYFATRFQSLRDLLWAAALSEYPAGKRHGHQTRIPRRVLEAAGHRLLSVEAQIQASEDFEELHDLVNEVIRSIEGIGELAVYDIATRIGWFLGIAPNYVFVHAGVRTGARALGFSGRERVAVEELPAAFHSLSPDEAEDCLCIFKDELQRLADA